MGFFLYNVYPARVFMGDTGSLALGGYVAAIAFVLKMPIFIVIVAFIYLIEVISVMMQVTWFKYTKKKYGEGRRIFKMAPLHHHFRKVLHRNTGCCSICCCNSNIVFNWIFRIIKERSNKSWIGKHKRF